MANQPVGDKDQDQALAELKGWLDRSFGATPPPPPGDWQRLKVRLHGDGAAARRRVGRDGSWGAALGFCVASVACLIAAVVIQPPDAADTAEAPGVHAASGLLGVAAVSDDLDSEYDQSLTPLAQLVNSVK